MEQKKIDWIKYWQGFTLGFAMLSWIILVFMLRFPLWILFPVFFVYLIINAIVFRSYSLAMLGNYYYFIRKPDKALKYYKKAVELNTINVPALYNYSLEMLHQGNGEEALKWLNRAEKYNTKLIYEKNIPLAISSCYWIMGGDENIHKAIGILEKLKDSYKYVNVSVYTTLGYFYLLINDLEKANEYTDIAIKENNEYAPAWDNRGQICYLKKEYDKAKEAFENALKYREFMVDSLYYMGKIAIIENDKEKAKEYFLKAAKCNISAMNTVTLEDINSELKKLV